MWFGTMRPKVAYRCSESPQNGKKIVSEVGTLPHDAEGASDIIESYFYNFIPLLHF